MCSMMSPYILLSLILISWTLAFKDCPWNLRQLYSTDSHLNSFYKAANVPSLMHCAHICLSTYHCDGVVFGRSNCEMFTSLIPAPLGRRCDVFHVRRKQWPQRFIMHHMHFKMKQNSNLKNKWRILDYNGKAKIAGQASFRNTSLPNNKWKTSNQVSPSNDNDLNNKNKIASRLSTDDNINNKRKMHKKNVVPSPNRSFNNKQIKIVSPVSSSNGIHHTTNKKTSDQKFTLQDNWHNHKRPLVDQVSSNSNMNNSNKKAADLLFSENDKREYNTRTDVDHKSSTTNTYNNKTKTTYQASSSNDNLHKNQKEVSDDVSSHNDNLNEKRMVAKTSSSQNTNLKDNQRKKGENISSSNYNLNNDQRKVSENRSSLHDNPKNNKRKEGENVSSSGDNLKNKRKANDHVSSSNDNLKNKRKANDHMSSSNDNLKNKRMANDHVSSSNDNLKNKRKANDGVSSSNNNLKSQRKVSSSNDNLKNKRKANDHVSSSNGKDYQRTVADNDNLNDNHNMLKMANDQTRAIDQVTSSNERLNNASTQNDNQFNNTKKVVNEVSSSYGNSNTNRTKTVDQRLSQQDNKIQMVDKKVSSGTNRSNSLDDHVSSTYDTLHNTKVKTADQRSFRNANLNDKSKSAGHKSSSSDHVDTDEKNLSPPGSAINDKITAHNILSPDTSQKRQIERLGHGRHRKRENTMVMHVVNESISTAHIPKSMFISKSKVVMATNDITVSTEAHCPLMPHNKIRPQPTHKMTKELCSHHDGYTYLQQTNICIKYTESKYNWFQARTQCWKEDADLFVMDSNEKRENCVEYLDKLGKIPAFAFLMKRFWIGLQALKCGSKWVDGSDMVLNWFPKHAIKDACICARADPFIGVGRRSCKKTAEAFMCEIV